MYVICDPYDSWACVARMWLVLCVYMRMICFWCVFYTTMCRTGLFCVPGICGGVAFSSMFKLSVHRACSAWCVNHGGAVRVGACGMLQHVCGMCVYGLCLGMACPASVINKQSNLWGQGSVDGGSWENTGKHNRRGNQCKQTEADSLVTMSPKTTFLKNKR